MAKSWLKTAVRMMLFTMGASAALGLVHDASAAEMAKSVNVTYAPLSFDMNGQWLTPPEGEGGFILDGTTYVPLRFMANALEKSVVWDGETYTVSVAEPTDAERQAIRGSLTAESPQDHPAQTEMTTAEIEVYERAIAYVFDGKQTEPPAGRMGLIYENRLYVPFRFMGESLGAAIGWNQETYTISMRMEAPEPGSEAPIPNGDAPVTDLVEEVTPLPVMPAPTAPSGATGGGGGGGSGSSKPTYASLTAAAESDMKKLKDRCERLLTPLAEQLLQADDLFAVLDGIMVEGEAILSECDRSFEGIVSKLEADLKRYNYDPSIINTYKQEYQRIKSEQIDRLMDQLS